VYGTERNSLIHPFEYGYVTQKTESDGSVHWYLHVSPSYWAEKKIVVNGVLDLPVSAVMFDSKNPVVFEKENNDLVISLPDECPNPYYATIDLYFQHPPTQVNNLLLRNNQVRLTPYQATTNSVFKNYIPYALTSWYYKYSEVDFNVYLEAGIYTLDAEYACWNQGGELYFNIDDQDYTANYENTGNPSIDNDINNYVSADLVKDINIPVSKVYSIKIQRNAEIPNVTNWINVRSFTFKKTSDNGIQSPDVLIYPTFVKDGYFVCESPIEQAIKIYDTLGRLRKTDTVGIYKKVDIHLLEPGIYIVKGTNFTQKIII